MATELAAGSSMPAPDPYSLFLSHSRVGESRLPPALLRLCWGLAAGLASARGAQRWGPPGCALCPSPLPQFPGMT